MLYQVHLTMRGFKTLIELRESMQTCLSSSSRFFCSLLKNKQNQLRLFRTQTPTSSPAYFFYLFRRTPYYSHLNVGDILHTK